MHHLKAYLSVNPFFISPLNLSLHLTELQTSPGRAGPAGTTSQIWRRAKPVCGPKPRYLCQTQTSTQI